MTDYVSVMLFFMLFTMIKNNFRFFQQDIYPAESNLQPWKG